MRPAPPAKGFAVHCLFLLVGAALIVGVGAVHGFWTERWHAPPDRESAAARLDRVPLRIGEWTGQPLELDPAEVSQARLTGAWRRRYVDSENDIQLTVVLMCGPPGPVSAHTPQWC